MLKRANIFVRFRSQGSELIFQRNIVLLAASSISAARGNRLRDSSRLRDCDGRKNRSARHSFKGKELISDDANNDRCKFRTKLLDRPSFLPFRSLPTGYAYPTRQFRSCNYAASIITLIGALCENVRVCLGPACSWERVASTSKLRPPPPPSRPIRPFVRMHLPNRRLLGL